MIEKNFKDYDSSGVENLIGASIREEVLFPVDFNDDSENKINIYMNGDSINIIPIILDYFAKQEPESDPRKFLLACIEKGISIDDEIIFCAPKAPLDWCSRIQVISLALYLLNKNYYFPYLFTMDNINFNYATFKLIFELFGIPLPVIPPKKDKFARIMHYIDICESLYEFRKHYGLSSNELIAFIYDFAVSILEFSENTLNLTDPGKIWFVGGNKVDFDFVDEASDESISYWQGNIESYCQICVRERRGISNQSQLILPPSGNLTPAITSLTK
jgi:hypothetical protein